MKMANVLTKKDPIFHLDLLPFAMKTRKNEQQIWDPTRRKWLIAEPEEIVRQGLIQFLHDELKVGFGRMSAEWGFNFNGLQKRLDLLILDDKGLPKLIAECKSWKVPLTQKAMQQLGTYNQVIKAPYALLCNGLHAILIKVDHVKKRSSIITKWPDLKINE